MWENILFSANIVVPSFVLIFLGWLARVKGLVSREIMDRIAKLTFKYVLSVKIFNDVAASDPESFSNFGMVAYCAVATVVIVLLIWAVAAKVLKRKESVGSFVQNSFRSSLTILGLTMIESFAGAEGVARCTLLIAVTIVVYNVLASIVLTRPEPGAGMGTFLKKMGRSVVTNPLIIASVLGMAVSFAGMEFPYIVDKPLHDLGNMAAPLSLLCIGSSLDASGLKRNFTYALSAACIKTWGMALIVLPVAVLLGFRGLDLMAITISFTSANPSANYVMALSTGNDSELAAAGILFSTVMCLFTTIAIITVLRTLGLV